MDKVARKSPNQDRFILLQSTFSHDQLRNDRDTRNGSLAQWMWSVTLKGSLITFAHEDEKCSSVIYGNLTSSLLLILLKKTGGLKIDIVSKILGKIKSFHQYDY